MTNLLFLFGVVLIAGVFGILLFGTRKVKYVGKSPPKSNANLGAPNKRSVNELKSRLGMVSKNSTGLGNTEDDANDLADAAADILSAATDDYDTTPNKIARELLNDSTNDSGNADSGTRHSGRDSETSVDSGTGHHSSHTASPSHVADYGSSPSSDHSSGHSTSHSHDSGHSSSYGGDSYGGSDYGGGHSGHDGGGFDGGGGHH